MKILYYISLISLLLSLGACEDWLDVQPKSEVRSKELFETPDGYRTAVNGIYINMATRSLYGKNLTWGFADALCQYINTNITSYNKVKEFDYDNPDVKSIITTIWEQQYNVIANCNNVLEAIGNIEDVNFFKENEKDLLTGELYCLRGMLHFELARLFAPSLKVGDKNIIPYYFSYSKRGAYSYKTSEIIDYALKDVEKGRKLLQKVDTLEVVVEDFKSTKYRFQTARISSEYNNRGYRMNYYAATALLARMNMYRGNAEKAYLYAREIIDSEIFQFTSEDDITTERDKRNIKLSDDIIFALYNKELPNYYIDSNSDNSYYCLYYPESYIFQNNKDDFRFTYLIERDNNWHSHSMKMLPVNDEDSKLSYEPIIPMIRMSELYYIACEYLYDTNKTKALKLFDSFRLQRGCKKQIDRMIDRESFINELIKDARKEFITEGQLWYMYKRLNHFIYSNTNESIEIEEEFTLPIPESETNIGNIN